MRTILSEQAVVLVFDHPVTLADGRFQTAPVEDRDMTAHVRNQSIFLQAPSRMGDAFSAHTQHVGNEFLRHHQFIRLQAVAAQEQPAAELLLHRVEAIADGGL